jgi:hypothetical protein
MKDGLSAEARAFALPLAAVAAVMLPVAALGLTVYWGDLTYLHHAWRASPAELVQAGRLPLWEPSLYFGLPMLGSMQGGLLYPAGTAFYFFGFATATWLFQASQLLLAAAFAFLWLRSLRLPAGAAAAGAALYALGGYAVSRLPFLNHLAATAWMPALPLLFARPLPLACALALMFLAGYPSMVPGACAGAWALAWALRAKGLPPWRRLAAGWAGAGLLALALSGAQLLPGLELLALSRRSAGVPLEEALLWSFTPAAFVRWTSPLLFWGRFRPEVDWWKCVYLGAFGAAAALAGMAALPRRRSGALALWLAVVAVLLLGGSNPLSRALWTHLTPLRFVRYPGNLAYLAWPVAALLAAAGLRRRRGAPLWAAALAAELAVLALLATPLAPRGLFTASGPLVPRLQRRLAADGTRYLLSPRALEADAGADVFDWKARLYGVTNAPYRLRAAANFGEPLVPAPSYALMDAVLSAPGAGAAAAWMPWLGASVLLTPEPPRADALETLGRVLWDVSAVRGRVSTAYLLDAAQARALAEGPLPPPAPGRPLLPSRPREDELSVSGEGGAFVYLAEPRYPGWRATLEAGGAAAPAEPRPALGAFQLFAVPAGPWTLRLRYDPPSFRLGLLLSAAALLGLGAYWYHRSPRVERL